MPSWVGNLVSASSEDACKYVDSVSNVALKDRLLFWVVGELHMTVGSVLTRPWVGGVCCDVVVSYVSGGRLLLAFTI